MDAKTIEKINRLARSLKENRLVASMEEAVAMATNMIGTSSQGEVKSAESIKEEVSVAEEKIEKIGEKVEQTSGDIEKLQKEVADEVQKLAELKEGLQEVRELKREAVVAGEELEHEGAFEEIAEKPLSEKKEKEKKALGFEVYEIGEEKDGESTGNAEVEHVENAENSQSQGE